MDFYIYTSKFSEKSEFYLYLKITICHYRTDQMSPFGKRVFFGKGPEKLFSRIFRNLCDTRLNWILCKCCNI